MELIDSALANTGIAVRKSPPQKLRRCIGTNSNEFELNGFRNVVPIFLHDY
jgi:hypothetical protein